MDQIDLAINALKISPGGGGGVNSKVYMDKCKKRQLQSAHKNSS